MEDNSSAESDSDYDSRKASSDQNCDTFPYDFSSEDSDSEYKEANSNKDPPNIRRPLRKESKLSFSKKTRFHFLSQHLIHRKSMHASDQKKLLWK